MEPFRRPLLTLVLGVAAFTFAAIVYGATENFQLEEIAVLVELVAVVVVLVSVVRIAWRLVRKPGAHAR